MTHMRDQYVQITNLFSQKAFAEGFDILNNVSGEMSESERLECIGNMHFYKREFQHAIREYEAAMKADPQYDIARYHYLIGVQEEQDGKLEDAFTRYQAAIEIEPSFVDSYVELGGLLTKVNDFEGALTCFTRALALDSNDLRNFANKVQILKRLSENNPEKYLQWYLLARNEFVEAQSHLSAIDKSSIW